MGTVHFACDCSTKIDSLPHFWEHTVGSCHAKLALRADYQTQLKRCHEELGFRHVRFHGLLCDDMSTLVVANKQFLYSFANADQIWDFLLSIGMKPFVELGFMPEALASGSTTVFHYRGNVTPPKDYHQWATLIGQLVGHWVQRYGLDEVRQWYFEVWNEPNLEQFWTGSPEEYFELYRRTVQAIRRVDSQLRVGGPATAKEEWIGEFLDYCDLHHLPVDFVSTHHYPNDVIWQEGQDTEWQLANGRRGVLREWAQSTRLRCQGLPLYYTEWNVSSNDRYPPQDEPYAAACVVKTVMEAAGLVDCYSFWTFSDIFEEHYFPSVPFHGGFGLLNLHGIAKPTYRAFEILHRLGTERLVVQGNHPTVDAWAVRKLHSLTILLTNHALPRQPIQTEDVLVRLTGLAGPRLGYVERIDREHANPKQLWQTMGEPEYPSAQQLERLQEASRLIPEPIAWKYGDGTLELTLELPPHAVAAITVG
jgi:xylan 1,4-beta-xylosidase